MRSMEIVGMAFVIVAQPRWSSHREVRVVTLALLVLEWRVWVLFWFIHRWVLRVGCIQQRGKDFTHICVGNVTTAAQKVKYRLRDPAGYSLAIHCGKLPRAKDANGAEASIIANCVRLKSATAPSRDGHSGLVNAGVFTGTSDFVHPVSCSGQRCSDRLCTASGSIVGNYHVTVASNFGMEGS